MSGTLNSALEDIGTALRASTLPDALNATTELLTIYPMSVRAWRARAAALEADGQFNQAAEAYGRVLDIVPSDAAALVAYARNLFAAGRADEADDAARQALDYDPDNALLRRYAHDGAGPAHIGTAGRIQFARNQFQSGLGNRAIAKLRGVLESHPSRIDAHVELADLLHRNSVRFTSAEICRHVLGSHPNCLLANAILAVHNQRIGNPDAAQQHMAVLAQIDPDGRETVALLGTRSPVQISDAPARGMAATATIEDDESRSDWVNQLIASTSTPPAPVSSKAAVTPPDPDTDENELLGKSIGGSIAASTTVSAIPDDVVDEHEATINFELPPLDWSGASAVDDDVANTAAIDGRLQPNNRVTVDDGQRVTDEGVLVEPLDWSPVDNSLTADAPADQSDSADAIELTDTHMRIDDTSDDAVDAAAEITTQQPEPNSLVDQDRTDDSELLADDEAESDSASDDDDVEFDLDDEGNETHLDRADDAIPGHGAADAVEQTNDDLAINDDAPQRSASNDTGIVFGRSSRRPLAIERGTDSPPAFIEHGARLIRVDAMKPDASAKPGARLKPADLLANARAAVAADEFEEAGAIYKQVVAKGRLLDDVIADLNQAIAVNPGVIALHETLGIALTRKGDVQSALTAFREAQRLARG